jgi:hypothetical protein
MNKLKDIVYDKNDLLIALIILLCAAFIIYQRIDVIMGYPGSLEVKAHTTTEENAVQYSGNTDKTSKDTASKDTDKTTADKTTTDKATADKDSGTDKSSANNAGKTKSEAITITIKYGDTGGDIAALLVESGLLDSKQEFYDAVSKAGADTRLKAGTFNIPLDSTPDEIIAVITK